MEVNNFLAGRRNPTPTDAVLAKCYYPMLCELAKQKKEMTFKEFVDAAKERYRPHAASFDQHHWYW